MLAAQISGFRMVETVTRFPTLSAPVSSIPFQKMLDVLTQSAAEQECVALGAHLASFETATEATAVKSEQQCEGNRNK